ncbi:hypothetical protein GBAR_LOCUS9635 [Geodia barretti]|uniref:Uncharacterized protein n=1 Tax=Geodia barretti TaxID=519541 RepID=A0AA35WBU1_GEOBA|nr:hypothetical protein GBAR_LOCUS9635 [Geodia barretti]
MLTPLSSLPSPTVDISSLKNSSHTPPSSAMATPTPTGDSSSSSSSRFLKQQRDGVGSTSGGTSGATASVSALTDRKSSVATQSSSRSSPPVTPGAAQRPHPMATPHQPRILESKKSGIPPSASGKLPPSTFAEPRVPPLPPLPSTSYISGLHSLPSPSLVASSAIRLPLPQQHHLPPTSPSVSSIPHPSPLSPVGIVLTPSSAGGTRSPGGGVLVQSQIRGTTSHSTVLAHPIKYPISPTPQVSPDHQQQGVASLRSLRKEREREREGNGKKRGGEAEVVPGEEGTGGEVTGGGGGSARTDSMGPPVKRVRVTRRTAAEEELAKQ